MLHGFIGKHHLKLGALHDVYAELHGEHMSMKQLLKNMYADSGRLRRKVCNASQTGNEKTL